MGVTYSCEGGTCAFERLPSRNLSDYPLNSPREEQVSSATVGTSHVFLLGKPMGVSLDIPMSSAWETRPSSHEVSTVTTSVVIDTPSGAVTRSIPCSAEHTG